MVAYAEGDMEAFQTLYDRHKNRVFGFLMAKLKDRSEAEDVFQAVFTKLHIARQKYRQGIPFLPWLFTIARNVLIDHARKKGTCMKHITASGEDVESYADPRSGTSFIGVAIAEFSNLTETQRQALELRFNEGLTFKEISVQMQTTADNARQIISRALRKLRKLMGGKEVRRERN